MNEKLNLVKILEGCPKGTEFYSPIFVKVEFINIDLNSTYSIKTDKTSFTSDGRYLENFTGECMIFPTKDQRDWSKFERFWDKPKVEKFDVNALQPFDKVLVKDGHLSEWTCTFFSHMANDVPFPVYCSGGCFKVCIPYNKETKHLVGTNEDCPEYYKWWEE